MSKELTIMAQLQFAKGLASVSTDSLRAQLDVAGNNYVKSTQVIGPDDDTLILNEVDVPGYILLRALGLSGSAVAPTAPAITAIAQGGTAGSTSYSYKVVGKFKDGSYSAASSVSTTTSGNATLSGANFNIVSWDDSGLYDGFDVYRTASGGTPSSTGLIASVLGNTGALTDDGSIPGDGSIAPAAGLAPILPFAKFGSDGYQYPVLVFNGEFALFRFRPFYSIGTGRDIHAIANTPMLIEYTLIEG